MTAATVASIKLPDGSVVAVNGWSDRPMYNTIDFAGVPADPYFHTGDPMVDAVRREKHALKKHKGGASPKPMKQFDARAMRENFKRQARSFR